MSSKKKKYVGFEVLDEEGCPWHEDPNMCCGHCPEGCP